jgi:hypothetical protein
MKPSGNNSIESRTGQRLYLSEVSSCNWVCIECQGVERRHSIGLHPVAFANAVKRMTSGEQIGAPNLQRIYVGLHVGPGPRDKQGQR